MKGMKKVFALVLVAIFAVGMLAACGKKEEPAPAGSGSSAAPAASTMKVGLICLHDENSTYDLNFINGFTEACKAEGVEYLIRTNIGETQDCYDTAVDLADKGCTLICADSFGHEDYMIQAAKEFPDVQFCHATGTKAHTENLPNYANAFASIYEGRFLAGVAAGMKLNEMIAAGKITADQAKMGYVGAFTYAEVISGYTSFYLGAKSVCPTVTMDVTFTGSWYDPAAEQEGAENLIKRGCALISQHADSLGAPTACENAGVPNVSYNGSTQAAGPNTFIVSSRINWAPYYKYAIQCVKAGKPVDKDWTGTLETDSVQNLLLANLRYLIPLHLQKMVHRLPLTRLTLTAIRLMNQIRKLSLTAHLQNPNSVPLRTLIFRSMASHCLIPHSNFTENNVGRLSCKASLSCF